MDVDAIMHHEDDYSICFCTNFEDEKIIRFRDVLIHDMYRKLGFKEVAYKKQLFFQLP